MGFVLGNGLPLEIFVDFKYFCAMTDNKGMTHSLLWRIFQTRYVRKVRLVFEAKQPSLQIRVEVFFPPLVFIRYLSKLDGIPLRGLVILD